MIEQELLQDLTESYLKSLISEISGRLSRDFDASAPFGELGIDSFYVLKIIRRLEADFGTLPKSLLFENFNVSDLANYFVSKHSQVLAAKFADKLQGSASVHHTNGRQATEVNVREEKKPSASNGINAAVTGTAPIHILEKEAYEHPELRELVQGLFERYKIEGSVSRGTRKIAPNLFIGSTRRGYFHYGRSRNIILVYGYTGPRDYVPALLEEMYQYCTARNFQINILADEEITSIGSRTFSSTPFGILQRILNLKEFALNGGEMRRLRYQVSKFEKSGTCKTEEYRCGSNPETDRNIAGIVDKWCATRTMVNPLVHEFKNEVLAGTLNPAHRLFLTYVNDVLQNVILITPMCQEENGYLMDLEFYPPEMPLGGLEFTITEIIKVLAAEGCGMLSLGGTYGCKSSSSAHPDPEVDKILDDLRQQNIFNDAGNLQFKNKFRPETKTIFLCRPAGSGHPDNVIDIIMMIADPEKVQTPDEENFNTATELHASEQPVKETKARAPSAGLSSISERSGIEENNRADVLAKFGFNPLNIPHGYVEFDLKTDSWAQLQMPAIETQMRHLHAQLQQPASVDENLRAVFPFTHFLLAASGQMAEHIFFKAWPKKGIVLHNLLFPSTIFHQIDKGFTNRELPHPAVFDLESDEKYKGNLDWQALQTQLVQDSGAIALVCIEVGNNAAGGHPVSMQHLKNVKALLAAHFIPLVIDGTRVVENAEFLIEHEKEYAGKSVWTVAREILSCADAVTGSLTKDFCVNKGGIIATNDARLFHRVQEIAHEEGSGTDLIDEKIIALSLENRKQIESRVLRRMEGVRLIWRELKKHNIPVVHPAGGHCILIDVKQVPEFTSFKYPVASFLAWLYLNTGIRAAAHSVGMQKHTRLNDTIRLAIPVGLKPDEISIVADRLAHAFERKINIPEVVMESSLPQPSGRIYVTYKLIKYHSTSKKFLGTEAEPIMAVLEAKASGGASSALALSPGSQKSAKGPSELQTATSGNVSQQPGSIQVTADRKPRRIQDIAIIGMAGRYPKAKNVRELWENLAQGRDCIGEIPADRYAWRMQHGSARKYRGGFIDDVDRFDSLFFNISPREAEMVDPQERLFLEVAWEAIEDAGYYPEILAQEDGSRNIGVFVGAVWAMYQMLGVEERHAGNLTVPNSFLWSIANRVSHCFNLSGPSMTVDTACSSSLTALYLACEAIYAGECSAAIVGGVNLDLHQAKTDINQAGGALSDDGVCRSFGKGANGYVQGEGVGALFLKPLERAVQDGDNIYGVIKSAVVNHGGRTSGYTVPNPKAQTSLISSALGRANIGAHSIGYIEAHGTGTELGDPIEITGLGNAFSRDNVANQTCAIGSLKSNIGHLEAAAGVAGISKVLLQMKHRQLAPSLHSAELNEFIDFQNSPFYVVQHPEEWKPREVNGLRFPLRAGVSSFGAGGANAHIILENYEPPRPADQQPSQSCPLIFPLSARNEDQLHEAAVRLSTFLQHNPVDLNDVSYTLQVGRKSFENRLAIIARTKEELLEKLASFIARTKAEEIVVGNTKSAEGFTRLLSRKEKEEIIRLLCQSRDPHKFAELWVEGLLADWQGHQTHISGKRISLPTYVFADKRLWAYQRSSVCRSLHTGASMHPMVDTNESTFDRQLFKKAFSERDFFIYDHHVANIPTLPGVAYLEFARKAGEMAAGRRVQKIRNIVWVSPISVQNWTAKEVFIELKPSEATVRFEVFSNDEKGNKVPHSQGLLLYTSMQEAAAEPEYIDLKSIRARCEKVIDGKDTYPKFKSFGLTLGPSFQVVQEVYKSENEILGILKLPEFRQPDLQSMVLHPSLVDGSLQAGVSAHLGGTTGEMLVPFSIGEVEILHPLQPDCFSYITEAKEAKKEGSKVRKSNVFIVDETGKVLVKIRESVGVPLRELYDKPAQDAGMAGFSRLYYSYEWEKAPLGMETAEEHIPSGLVLFDTEETLRDGYQERLRRAGKKADQVILVRPGENFQDLGKSYTINPQNKDDFIRLVAVLIEKQCSVENICFAWPAGHFDLHDEKCLKESLERGVYSFLFLCQALIKNKVDTKAQLLYLYSAKPGEGHSQNDAMRGFINTLHLEHPKLICKTVEIRQENAGCEQTLEALVAELQARIQDATAVRHEGQERFIKKLKAFGPEEMAGTSSSQDPVIRERGVYQITGGAGGLGLIFAEFLAKEYKARLVLTGRSQLPVDKEAKFDEFRKSGAEVLYLSADVSNYEDVRNVVNETRARFGEINGVIHAAGVLRDSLIRNKKPEEMSAVFAPKVYGALYLDELTTNDKLDFFVTFSSLAAVAGNGGQCDYSFANHFMDSFAAERELLRARGARSGKTLSLNWSIWADGAMKLDEQTELYFKKTLGIKPLSKKTGLEAFVKGIVSEKSHFVVLEGVQEKVELAWGLRKKEPAPVSPPAMQPAAAPASGGGEDLRAWLQEELSQIVMEFLKLDPSDMATDKILLDLGFDSIGLTTYANTINEKFQLDITPVLFFDYPTVEEIARYLSVERESEIRQFYPGSANGTPGATPAPSAPSKTKAESAVTHRETTLEIKKGWNPAVLDRGAVQQIASAGFSPETRFVNTPIAIVGMAGVMPQSEDLEEFWENLKNSKDMISIIPPDRWRWENYYGDPFKEVNKSNSKWGGFMKEIDKFDPLFFGISPREAQTMDPQQRIFLQTVWKAIEDSGQKVSDLSGTRTGLFVGVATNDYIDVMSRLQVALDGYSASGNSHSVLANRVSFLLNLRGPSAPLDTACSSSLVALHRAIESIHTGSCDMAIVGGVQVMLSPAAYISFSMAGMLSGDGKCKAFDKRANGYVRGEGCGAVFLKRLSAAEADGNHIYAVIRATAENHGGRVTTLTAPNSSAQSTLLIEAYEKAQIDPTTIGYIECHGTGTSLGDPIEIQALSKAFAELYKKRNKPPAKTPHCGLSSVKTNIGHLETAAGIASLLKVLLAIQHKHIPANIHFEEINPYINLNGTPFYIADKLTPWEVPRGEHGAPVPRRAGVSSFGFGGANAHIVLEEYLPPKRQPLPEAHGLQLIVLSAKNEDRLKAYVQSMQAYLEKAEVEPIDVAYTLQVGRDEMPERLALVVSSIQDLRQKFDQILKGERPEDSYWNTVKSKEAKSQSPAGELEIIRNLVEEKKLSRLAELWVSGTKIDWRLLYKSGVPRRIPVPTYPFAKERYWIPEAEKAVQAERTDILEPKHDSRMTVAFLHPLVHRNVSTLEEQKFASRFSGEEFYLADHVVETQKILPGVAYLEMARAAGELAANAKVRVIRNVTWERPLVVGTNEEDIEISLTPVANEIKFSVKTAGKEEPIVHCTGKLAYSLNTSMPKSLDIAAIQQRCSEEVISGKDLYPALSASGLKLGKSLQIVQRIYANESEALAVLHLPEHLQRDAGQFWLHPALMEGSLHTGFGLMRKTEIDQPLSMPYSVGEVQIFHPLKELYYGYATWAVDNPKANPNLLKVTYHLLDKNGTILVRIKNLMPRPRKQAATQAVLQKRSAQPPGVIVQEETKASLQCLVPVWNSLKLASCRRPAPPASSRILLLRDPSHLEWLQKCYPNSQVLQFAPTADIETIKKKFDDCAFDHLLWIAPDIDLGPNAATQRHELLIAQQEEGVLALFRIIKALLQSGYGNKKIEWTVITAMTQQVTKDEAIHPAHAGIAGLIGSAAKEFPQWQLRLLDVDSLRSLSVQECLSVPSDPEGNMLAYRRGEWFQQGLALVPTVAERKPGYRQNGVYVVIGGAGGLGEVWTRFMMEHYQANVVWIGRRKYDAAIERKINSLTRQGRAPLYISADAGKLEELEYACQRILKSYSSIHGVIHSAIVLNDQTIARMDESGFRASLSAKVDVSVNMERVFGSQELDFMLFFSSIVSFIQSPGQSNYAAGCSFKDSFAKRLQQLRAYPVKIMNWGYWGDVGVVAAESYRKIMAQMGVGSIGQEEGMASLRALVSSDIPQLALIKTLNSRPTAALNLSEVITYYPQTTPAMLPPATKELVDQVGKRPVSALARELPTSDMTAFVAEALASSLISLGLCRNGISRIGELSLNKQPAPYYERWLSSSIRYLQQQSWLGPDLALTREVRTLTDLWAAWDASRSAWANNPMLQAQSALLEVCLRALPGILSGQQSATDVMFPNSSMHLIEGIYRGNVLADYYNEILGETVRGCIEQQLREDKARQIRILEIGAGTGGTTAKLLPLLKQFPVAEYCYTDISKAFLIYGEANFKPQFSALITSIFDITKPLASQSIATNQYDFVIAANVLHATPDIRETVRNAKAALKNRGILLLNEISTWSLFTHLTFGLLEGWWLHEDIEIRLPGSPGLAPEKWQMILAGEGFESIVFPAEKAHEFGQQIIAAASNGWVRQRIRKPAPSQRTAVVEQKDAKAVGPSSATNANQTIKNTSPSGSMTEQMSTDYIRQIIIEELATALKVDAAQLANDEPFAEWGVDSIIGVSVIRVICERLQIELDITKLFEFNTVNQLTEYIWSNWHEQIEQKFVPTHVTATPTFSTDMVPMVGVPAESRFINKKQLADVQSTPDFGHGSESTSSVDPIAIIGMSGRFAESDSLDALWENLVQGRHLVKRVSRWSEADCVMSEAAGQVYCSYGGFVDSIDEFDPAFFGISSQEATYMDPQQRLFLEESWKALEDSGYAGKNAQEKQCGVYVGCGSSNYSTLFLEEPPAHAFWGNSESVIPARIAYHLNLQGPAIAIDTACSSSLVAIHMACQGLWSRETEMALAGGVFLHVTPVFYQVANRAGMLSPEGKCYSFDARANGFVPGEGVGVVVLKRLHDALRDGDHVYGVIAGSGINQDGSSNGLIAPNPRAQEKLERSVYDRFKVNPETIHVLEAHGTGTIVGDSIEYTAIRRAFGEYTDKKQFCAVGTVKSNIGHAATAAGIAGVLKVLLSLQHRQIPPSVHFDKSNPALDLESGPFYVNTQLKEWAVENNEKRRAAISAFGFSGTNAHLVIEEAPVIERDVVVLPAYLIVLSARTSEQLIQQVHNLVAFLKLTTDISMNNLSFSLFVGRMHFGHRLSCLARNQGELIHFLEEWMTTGTAGQIYTSEIQESKIREQVSLKKFGNYCIQECRNAEDSASYLENLAVIAELYVQGYSLNFPGLFSGDSRKMPLPVYPFAKQRYWVDAAIPARTRSTAAISARLHPLLHTNTSTFSQLSYSARFTGAEFFLIQHGDAGRKILPGVACLEMARAALEKAAIPHAASVIELQDTVWGYPVVITGNEAVTIALLTSESESTDFEIYSGDTGQDVIHCQGRACFSDQAAPVRLDMDQLQRQMQQGKLDPESMYAESAEIGIHCGPAHRVIAAVYTGDKQLLARLSLPGFATGKQTGMEQDFLLHPSLMGAALQTGAKLIADGIQPSAPALLPRSLKSLRVLLPCPREMFAWVRRAEGASPEDKLVKLDIDLMDDQGNICVEMRSLSFQGAAATETAVQRTWDFCKGPPPNPGEIVAPNSPMGAAEKLALFLKQETALQLQKQIEKVPTDCNYFALGLTSLGLTHLIQRLNQLLDKNLAPSTLFEYGDIQSLSAYLAAAYPSEVAAVTVVRAKAKENGAAQQRQLDPGTLTALPRKRTFSSKVVPALRAQAEAVVPAKEMSSDLVLEKVLWQEAALNEDYERVTF